MRGGSAHARATKLLDLSTVRVQVRPLALASFRSKLTLFVIAVTRLQVNMSGGPNITDWVANMMVSLGLRGGKTFLRAAFARMREVFFFFFEFAFIVLNLWAIRHVTTYTMRRRQYVNRKRKYVKRRVRTPGLEARGDKGVSKEVRRVLRL